LAVAPREHAGLMLQTWHGGFQFITRALSHTRAAVGNRHGAARLFLGYLQLL